MNSMLKDGKSVEEIRQEFIQDYIDFEIDEMLQKLQLAGAKKELKWTKLYQITGAILSVLLMVIIGYIVGAEATGKVEVLNIWSRLAGGVTIVAIFVTYISRKNLIGYASSIFAYCSCLSWEKSYQLYSERYWGQSCLSWCMFWQ